MNESPVTSEDNKSGHMTSGVRTLMGDPRKAILKLGMPMILAMSVQTVYILVDSSGFQVLVPTPLQQLVLFFLSSWQ
jgi:hypothetical protein